MGGWITRSLSRQVWGLTKAWLMGSLQAPPRRAPRPLDLRALSPHLLRDIGVRDAAHDRIGRGLHMD